MFWYKDFLCCFFRFHFARISSDFSSGALGQNVLPQDFATNSFVRISLGFRQNLNWSNEIFDEISTIFFGGKMLWQNVLPQGKMSSLLAFWRNFPCGKTFCHNILPQKKLSKFRPKLRWNFVKLELKQRNLWRNFNEILTIIFCGKRCGKMDCHKDCHEIFNESFNELSTTDWRNIIPIANHEQHQHKV